MIKSVAGAISVLVGKFLYTNVKKLSEMELKPSKILNQPKIRSKIESIPRLFLSSY